MSEHLPGWQRLALAWLPQTLRGRLLVLGSLSLILADRKSTRLKSSH